MPAEHDGSTAFDIRFHLTAEPAGLSFRTVQNGLFDVTGGSIEKASRLVAGKNNGWTLSMAPSGLGDVTVRVNGTTACDTAPGVCTRMGASCLGAHGKHRRPRSALGRGCGGRGRRRCDTRVHSDVEQGALRDDHGELRDLGRQRNSGGGLHRAIGTLTFGRLETSQTVSVPVLDDDHDEGSETLTLTLSNVSDNVRLGEATATGTITNRTRCPGR